MGLTNNIIAHYTNINMGMKYFSFKKAGYWVYTTYNNIFNYNLNPLSNVDSVRVRVIATIVLATLWSIAFGITFHSYWYAASSFLGHNLITGMVFFTVYTFKRAEKTKEVWFLQFKHRLWLSKVHKDITEKNDYKKSWNIGTKDSDK